MLRSLKDVQLRLGCVWDERSTAFICTSEETRARLCRTPLEDKSATICFCRTLRGLTLVCSLQKKKRRATLKHNIVWLNCYLRWTRWSEDVPELMEGWGNACGTLVSMLLHPQPDHFRTSIKLRHLSTSSLRWLYDAGTINQGSWPGVLYENYCLLASLPLLPHRTNPKKPMRYNYTVPLHTSLNSYSSCVSRSANTRF